MIVKRDGKYHVMSEDGSKHLGGPYASEDEAQQRLRQVEYFKHRDNGLQPLQKGGRR